jgi:hypothetical protein
VHRLAGLDRFQRAWVVAVAAAVALACVALVWTLVAEGWTQVGDEANQIHGAQRAFLEWPLVGDFNTANLYGNPSSHHPGPVAWYLLAPWVMALGPQLGAWLFAIFWNSAWLALTGWFAHRAGGPRVAAVAVLAGLAAFAVVVPGQYASTFFQVLPLFPLLFCLVASWSLARRDTLSFPFLVLAATFVVQSATLNLPLLAVVLATATGLAVMAYRRDRALPPRAGTHLAVGTALGIALWAPPIADQLLGSGNLGLLATADIPHAGVGGILPNLRGTLDRYWHMAQIRLLLIAAGVSLAVAAANAIRRRGPTPSPQGPLGVLVVAALAGSVATGALLPEDDFETSHWMWLALVAGFLCVAVVAWTTQRERPSVPKRAIASAATAVALLASLSLIARPYLASPLDRAVMSVVDDMVHGVDVELDEVDGPLRIAGHGGWIGTRLVQSLLPRAAGPPERIWLTTGTDAHLVVIRNRPARWQRGEVIASEEPAVPPVDVGLPDRIAEWFPSGGELVLREHVDGLLAQMVDGRIESACLPDLVADPSPLLADPELLADVYAANLVASPRLPRELSIPLFDWYAGHRLSIVRVPPGGPAGDDFIWTEDSC